MDINFKKLCLAAAISSAALAMSGCKDESSPVSPPVPPVEPPTGELQLQKHQVAIYYKRDELARTAADYEGWGLHVWDDKSGQYDLADGVETSWPKTIAPAGVHPTKGAYFVVNLNAERNRECIPK